MLHEMFQRVAKEDPVRGIWAVAPIQQARLRCDASSLAMGCALEIDNAIVEDAAWLRKKSDGAHINMA